MDASNHPEPPDLTLHLPRDVYYQLVHKLRAAVAPVSESPEDIVRRDNAIIAQIAGLLPANADEANLAALYVVASARSLDLARIALEYADKDHAFALKLDVQAAKMVRQAQATRALLLRVQAARRKLEADDTAANQAAWIEHCVVGFMAEALGRTPPAPMAEPPPPAPEEDDEPRRDPIAEAERYAVIYPDRAIGIRKHGGMPPGAKFGPPDDYLVRALVTGQTPRLRALDLQAG